MAERYTIYSNVVGSTFKAYLEYELRDDGKEYYVGVYDFGLVGTSSSWKAKWNADSTFEVEVTDDAGIGFESGYPTTEEVTTITKNEKLSLLQPPMSRFWCPFPKTTTADAHTLKLSINLPRWTRVPTGSGESTSYFGSGLSIQLNVTVPALTKPVASITATRDANTPTALGISVTVNSFEDDEISSITVVDGNGNPLGSTSSTIVIPSSGQIVQPFVTQGVTTGSIVAKVVVIGLGGASAEASVVIPVAFFTMDVQRGGKEIAFGSSAIDSDAQASEHGIFNCFMEAKFHNGIVSDNPLFRTDTTTTASRSWSAKGTALAQFSYKPDAIAGYTPIALVGAISNNTNVTVSAYYDGSIVRGHAYNHNTSAVSTNLVLRFLYVQNGLI